MNLRTKLSYLSVNFAMEHANSIFILFGLWYVTDIAMLRPSLAGYLAIIYRIWDALNDPVVGCLSDLTHTRYGRRVPWLAVGVIPYIFCFLMFWNSPTTTQAKLFLFLVFIQCGLDAGYTCIFVPHITLLNDLTSDYNERFRMNIWRFVAQLFGSAAAFLVAMLIFNVIQDPQKQFEILAICIATVCCPCILWCCYECRFIQSSTKESNTTKIKADKLF